MDTTVLILLLLGIGAMVLAGWFRRRSLSRHLPPDRPPGTDPALSPSQEVQGAPTLRSDEKPPVERELEERER